MADIEGGKVEMMASVVEANIEQLKRYIRATYPHMSEIRVIASSSDESRLRLVKLTPFSEYELNVTVQLDDTMDARVIVTASSSASSSAAACDQQRLARVAQRLDALLLAANANNNNGKSDHVLVDFFIGALSAVEADYAAMIAANNEKINTNSSSKQSRGLKKKSSHENNDDQPATATTTTTTEKKCSMKTASDVVKRIQWDERIEKARVLVGYLDHFDDFDWGDIVLADIGALAIPEHRICYFKYDGELVWDKQTRLDNVFGSTGSRLTIHDVIERAASGQATSSTSRPLTHDDNGAEVAVALDVSVPEAQDEAHTQAVKGVEETEKSGAGVEKQDAKLQPNYFLSIPIDDEEIAANLASLAADLVASNADLAHIMLPHTSHHLTVCTLRLDTDAEMSAMRELLDTLERDEQLMGAVRAVSVQVRGLDHFYDKVFFAKCHSEHTRTLEELKRRVLDAMSAANIRAPGNYYEFVPHLTVFKLTQKNTPMLRRRMRSQQGTRGGQLKVTSLVDVDVWHKYGAKLFGEQRLRHIHLCKMVNIDKFKTYPVEHTLNLFATTTTTTTTTDTATIEEQITTKTSELEMCT